MRRGSHGCPPRGACVPEELPNWPSVATARITVAIGCRTVSNEDCSAALVGEVFRMRSRSNAVLGTPTEIDMEPLSPWHWRIVIIGEGWTTEQQFRGPRWLAKRHVRRLFHELRSP